MTTRHDHTIFEIKEGDRLPVLKCKLLDCEGNPLDLTPYEDAFLVVSKCVGGRRIIDMQVMTKETPLTDGIVTYAWAVGDTDVPGDYNLEVVLSPDFNVAPASDQKLMTLPGGGYGKLKITARL